MKQETFQTLVHMYIFMLKMEQWWIGDPVVLAIDSLGFPDPHSPHLVSSIPCWVASYLHPCLQCRNLSQSPFQGSHTLRWASPLLFLKQNVLLHKGFNLHVGYLIMQSCPQPSRTPTLHSPAWTHSWMPTCLFLQHRAPVFASSSNEIESLQKHPARTMYQCLRNWKGHQKPFSQTFHYNFEMKSFRICNKKNSESMSFSGSFNW